MATCQACGRSEPEPPLTWTVQVSSRHGQASREWLCDVCTRDNVRSIEARLDESWW